MTREEEIKQAAENYAASVCKDCAARFYCKERIRKCYEYREQVTVYADAAMWADEHPKNVWHDASEMPDKQGNLLYILPQGSLHISNIPSALRTCKLDKVRWEEYAKELGVVKWAYINDLLPKNK